MTNRLIGILMVGALAPTAMGQSQSGDMTSIRGRVACNAGFSAAFPCQAIDLLSVTAPSDLGAAEGVTMNDVWGWTDSDGTEYVLAGRQDGTAVVDISDPEHPVYVANIPTSTLATVWRDIKTYRDHAFIVADAAGRHGIQVVDLTRVRDFAGTPLTLEPDTIYRFVGSAHNIAINEQSGFAYAVGTSFDARCGRGLHAVDVRDPMSPEFAGCFVDPSTGIRSDGYTHDTQCVIYSGPDTEHAGKEICFSSNETAISIADVTDKTATVPLSIAAAPPVGYVHQAWLTADQRYLFQNDELDERSFGVSTRTIVWDVSDLDNPVLAGEYSGPTQSVDHNLYVVGDYMFETNYTSGLRILDISDPLSPLEIAYFDTIPDNDDPVFNGTWSSYPFFDSQVIAVTSFDEGLFLLNATGLSFSVGTDGAEVPSTSHLADVFPNPADTEIGVVVELAETREVRIELFDMLGRKVMAVFEDEFRPGRRTIEFSTEGLSSGMYMVRLYAGGTVESRSVVVAK